MTTCIEAINAAMGNINSIPEIFPGTVMPIGVAVNDSQLYRIRSPMFQTINFNVNITSSPSGLTMTFYQSQAGSYFPTGSINITSNSTNFSADFPAGDHIVCIRSRVASAQAGSFVCTFTPYPSTPFFEARGADGQVATAILTTVRRPVECNEALFFDLIDGELPPGLSMDALGVITGILPNLDCLPDRLSPSAGWYYDEIDDLSYPWGREWRFRVRLGLATDAAVPVEEDFCIRVHNNWDFDQANFLSQAPFRRIDEIRVVRQPDVLPEVLCEPCKPIEQAPIPVLKDIEPVCAACTNPNQSAFVEMIEIPVELCQIPANDMIAWYDRNKDTASDCRSVNQFIADLDNSDGFQLLRRRAGYVPDEPVPQAILDTTFVAVSAFDRFLQLATVRLDPASDLNSMAAMVDMWREQENQVLPTRTTSFTGEGMEVRIA